MEQVDGMDLFTLVQTSPPLSIERVVHLLREIANGLRAAHRCGIVHRDLKPENVMVRALPEGEVVKILDFGIAAGVTTPGADGKRMTRVGMAIGTPAYMAPEQVDGDDPSPRFDIYALGVVGFELLTGRLPIEDDVPMRLMARKCNETAPRVDALREDVPPALADLIADCLQIDPDARPQSVEDVLDRLASVIPPQGPRRERDGPVVDGDASARTPATAPRQKAATPAHGPPPTTTRSRWLEVAVGSAIVVLGLGAVWAVAGRGGSGEASAAVSEATSSPKASPTDVSPGPPATEMPPSPIEHGEDPPTPASDATSSAPAVAHEEEAPSVAPAPASAPAPAPASAPPSPGFDAADGKPRTGAAAGGKHCATVRTRAEDARRAQDWQSLLRAAREAECWRSRAKRTKALTRAYMELGRFGDCVRAGRHSRDPDVERWVTLCERRAG
jgi:serine/threonine-protein kinase